MRNRFNSLCPNSLVELRVETDICGSHSLLSEIDDGFHSPGSTLFERTAMYTFVKVDGIFAGDDVLKGRASLAAGLMIKDERIRLGVERFYKVSTFFLVLVGA